MANELVPVVGENEAQVNVTYGGNNGDLAQTVFFESSDADVKAWVTEALRAGSIPGLGAHVNADLHDYVVDRHKPTEARPHNLIQIRPKTAYGMGGACVCPTCGNAHQGR
jgi:hypothetical protein